MSSPHDDQYPQMQNYESDVQYDNKDQSMFCFHFVLIAHCGVYLKKWEMSYLYICVLHS